MSDLETTRSELEATLETLLTGPKLPVNEALTRLSNIVDLAGDYTLKLEAAGRLAETATWYKKVAQAFEATAQKMPEEEDKQRIASLGTYWLLKAQRVTVEPASEPLPYIEQRRDPTADHSSLKIHRQGLKLETDKPGQRTPVRPQQVVDLKPGGAQVGRGTRVRTSPIPGKVRTLLSSEQVEREAGEHQSTRTKRLDLDGDSEDTPVPEKGA